MKHCIAIGLQSGLRLILYCFALYFIAIITALPYDGFIQMNSIPLPQESSGAAIGYNALNHTIWLLGGDPYNYQLISYNYLENTFKLHGLSLNVVVLGDSQYYVQMDHILYIANYFGSYINTFNTQTVTFTTNYTSVPLSFVHNRWGLSPGCVVGIRNKYLVVMGYDAVVQILNIETHFWLQNVPSLQIGRYASSCIYVNDKIFNIGGIDIDNDVTFASIEYLNVSTALMMDIASISWKYMINELPQPLSHSRCIIVNDDILVIGGWGNRNGDHEDIKLNTIYVINSINGSVSLGGYLAVAIWNTAAIFVGDIIYCFGGHIFINGSADTPDQWNGWQMKSLEWMISSTLSPLTSQHTITTYMNHEIQTNVYVPTVINITLSINHSVSINDVINTVNHSITTYLIANNIVYPLETDVIQREDTILIILQISTQLDGDEINIKEIEDITRSDLDKQFDGKVKVKDITTNVDQNEDENNDNGKDDTVLWIIVSVVFVVLIFAVTVIMWKQSKRSKISFIASSYKMNEKAKEDSDQKVSVKQSVKQSHEMTLIKYWLRNVVKLPSYFDIFVDNGYESLQFIREIKDEKELEKMGIGNDVHRTRIMHEIEILRKNRKDHHEDSEGIPHETQTHIQETNGNCSDSSENDRQLPQHVTVMGFTNQCAGENDNEFECKNNTKENDKKPITYTIMGAVNNTQKDMKSNITLIGMGFTNECAGDNDNEFECKKNTKENDKKPITYTIMGAVNNTQKDMNSKITLIGMCDDNETISVITNKRTQGNMDEDAFDDK